MLITEKQFSTKLKLKLQMLTPVTPFKSVIGPGRSGAIASVYVSHLLRVPWLPANAEVPYNLQPCLVVDTAMQSGRTLRKAMAKANTSWGLAVFREPPRVRFWYEKN